MDYSKRKDQLDLREKELAAREAELAKTQEELRLSGAIKPKKNWPRCYPITHHDIKGEVSCGCQQATFMHSNAARWSREEVERS